MLLTFRVANLDGAEAAGRCEALQSLRRSMKILTRDGSIHVTPASSSGGEEG